MMQLTLATWQPVRRGLVAAGRAAASGPALHVGSLALALAISAVALRTLTAPVGPLPLPPDANRPPATLPARAVAVRQPAAGAESAPARPRTAPTYYLVDSEAEAALVAQAINEAVRLAHALEAPVEEFLDTHVVVVAADDAWMERENALDAQRRAMGQPGVRVVDLRVR